MSTTRSSKVSKLCGWLLSSALMMMTLTMTVKAINSAAAKHGSLSRAAPVSPGNPNAGAGLHIPSFSSVGELCQWLCERQSPDFNYGCPPSCDGSILDSWSKRATRSRRYDDFTFGFDDYLFLKLLGRNFGDRRAQ